MSSFFITVNISCRATSVSTIKNNKIAGNMYLFTQKKWQDELGIAPHDNKKKSSYDVDLDAFMNPASGSIHGDSNAYNGRGDTVSNVQQLIQAAK